MAEVKMDLAELKAMENEIVELKKVNKDLQDKQPMVLINHRGFKGRIKRADKVAFSNHRVDVTAIKWSNAIRSYGETSEYMHSTDISIDQLVEKGLITFVIERDENADTKDYVNLSDISETIKSEITASFEYNLTIAKDRATKAEFDSSVIEDKYKKDRLAFNNKVEQTFTKKLENAEKEFSTTLDKQKQDIEILNKAALDTKEKQKQLGIKTANKYDKLHQEFEDFKVDKKRVSIEDQLKAIKERSLIARIINK